MTSHDEVARAWSNGDECTGSRMFTDGTTIYSYGEHFPIATKVSGAILFNTDRYSSSTSKHQSIVRRYCHDSVECDTEEIKRAVNDPTEPIVITKTVQHTTITECLENMKTIFNAKGKRFPMKKLTSDLLAEMV